MYLYKEIRLKIGNQWWKYQTKIKARSQTLKIDSTGESDCPSWGHGQGGLLSHHSLRPGPWNENRHVSRMEKKAEGPSKGWSLKRPRTWAEGEQGHQEERSPGHGAHFPNPLASGWRWLWVSLYLLLSSLGEGCVGWGIMQIGSHSTIKIWVLRTGLGFPVSRTQGLCEISVCPLRGSTCCLSDLTQAMDVGTGSFPINHLSWFQPHTSEKTHSAPWWHPLRKSHGGGNCRRMVALFK